MRGRLFAFAATVAVSFCGAVSAEEPSLFIHGIGSVSCATWLSTPDQEREGTAWLLGFWTGMNYGTDDLTVGQETDTLGIVAAVKDSCRSDPSELLAIHTMVVFDKFRALGR